MQTPLTGVNFEVCSGCQVNALHSCMSDCAVCFSVPRSSPSLGVQRSSGFTLTFLAKMRKLSAYVSAADCCC